MNNKIIDIIQKTAIISKEIKTTDNLLSDLGLDSLDAVEVIMEIEKEFNISIADDVWSKIHTVQDIIDEVEKITSK